MSLAVHNTEQLLAEGYPIHPDSNPNCPRNFKKDGATKMPNRNTLILLALKIPYDTAEPGILRHVKKNRASPPLLDLGLTTDNRLSV
jgi:hypothetical protein